MAKVLDEKTKDELRPVLALLKDPVKLLFFTQANACPGCAQQEEILRDLSAMSIKIGLQVYTLPADKDEAQKYRIDKIPATAVLGTRDYGIRFYGLTAGFEFSSLIEDILMVSSGQSNLDPHLEEMVKGIEEDVHLQVMATLTCQYCPAMVHITHQFAFVNNNISADMVELAEFPHLSQKYNVTGVPRTIINDDVTFDGAISPAATYLKIIQAISPARFAEADRRVRQIQGIDRTRNADEKHEYEVAIVGGGPAGMSAAVYAVRKGLDVVLIADKLGGQINYTADIDNYLGFANFNGADMAEAFRRHVEKFPIAEALGVTVKRIGKNENGFSLFAGDAVEYKALSVIYCAGKEYLRLGVPGEERFIGRGIGFCATCDAPLYKGRKVAVVGGGNSAFTSVRDLVNFASEIHLISRRKEFKADLPLVEEVKKSKNVVIHAPAEVREFLGSENLKGLRIESVDAKIGMDLAVDGAFLEIGLVPNSGPLDGLVQLDKYGQIPVNRDQSSKTPGFFAAGDITDVEEKQVSIAVGQGALAAISAYKYLMENRLTKSKSAVKEMWE